MKSYSVKELAKLSGVTVRTLHHYDKIGLLKPLNRTEAGYRKYGEEELLRLQQILFYRELDFTLKEISEVLDDPDFDLLTALKEHKQNLLKKSRQLKNLAKIIDTTIKNLKNNSVMTNPKDLYEGMSPEMKGFRDEAVEKYGEKSIKRSENYLSTLSKDERMNLVNRQQQNMRDLAGMVHENPASEKVQEAISEHYQIIRMFWGTHGTEDPQLEGYRALGGLYMSDERFSMIDGKPNPEYVNFIVRVMSHFVDNFER